MKKQLIIVPVAVVLLGVCAFAVGRHQSHTQKEQKQAQVAEDKRIAAVQTQANSRVDAVELELTNLRTECQKGAVAYGLLTPSQISKAKLTQPVCQTPQVR